MSKFFRRFSCIFCICCCIILIIVVIQFFRREETYISYDQVLLYLQKEEISSIEVKTNASQIRITLNDESVKRSIIPSMESFSLIIFEKIENGSKIEFEVIPDRTTHFVLVVLTIIAVCLCIFLIFLTYRLEIKKNIKRQEKDEWTYAVHEAGHAIVAYAIAPQLQIINISIVHKSEDNSNGRVEYDSNDFQNITTQNKLQIFYAGKAAENLILKTNSYGWYSDLTKATSCVYDDIFNNVSSDSLLVKLPNKKEFNRQLVFYKVTTMNKICKEEYNKVCSLIKKYESQIIELAQILISQKTLSQEQIEKFMKEKI